MLYQCVYIFLSFAFINCAPLTENWVEGLKDVVNIQNNATVPAVNTTVSYQAKAYPYPDQYVVQPTYTTQQTYVPAQSYITQPTYTQPTQTYTQPTQQVYVTQPTYATQQTYVPQPSYVTQQTYAQPTQTYAQPTQTYTQPTQQVYVTQPYNREFVNFDGTPYVPTTVYPTTTATGGAVTYPAGYPTPAYPTAAVNPYDPTFYATNPAYAAYPTYASPYGYGAPVPAPSPYGTSPYQSYPPNYGSASHYQQHGSSSYS